jgi:hypothetical protein
MMIMFSKLFWAGTLERAIKTFCQVVLTYFGATAVGLLHADWPGALDLGAGAAVLSVLTSMATATTVVSTSPLSAANAPVGTVGNPVIIPPQGGKSGTL